MRGAVKGKRAAGEEGGGRREGGRVGGVEVFGEGVAGGRGVIMCVFLVFEGGGVRSCLIVLFLSAGPLEGWLLEVGRGEEVREASLK